MKVIFSLIRPHQWLKNGFVLVGILFSHQWSDLDKVLAVALSFVAFCLASSTVYVFNDYRDRARDALHPRKRHRPIASGKVSLTQAKYLMAVLFSGAIVLPLLSAQYATLALVLAYLLLNTAYTVQLKNLVLIDVFCIVAGFMLRLACGTYAVGIPPSRWIWLCSFMLTLFLGFAKRRAELATASSEAFSQGDSSRMVLQDYSLPLLDTLIAITASAALLAYGLYTVDTNNIALHGTEHLIMTLPIVTFGMFRYLYLLYQRGSGEDPGRDILQDRQVCLAVLVWVATVLALVDH